MRNVPSSNGEWSHYSGKAMSNTHGGIATRLMKNHLIMQGKSLTVNKVLVRLKEVYLPREAPTY